MQIDTLLKRRTASALILAATATLLGGCPSISWHQAPPSTPLESPVDIARDGPIVHAGSQIEFPQSAAGFVRRFAERYDAEGNDVGIGYGRIWSNAAVTVTIFVYPCALPPAAADEAAASSHLDRVLAELEHHHESVEVVRRTGGKTTFHGVTYPWAAAEVTHAPGPQWCGRPVTGAATVTPAGSWWIKTRVTMPRDARDRALGAVDDLLRELRLPQTGLHPSE